MNTNIFVPSKINVGFQNRQGTYTGKLAYVIYFDEKGKLRKEASWNSWRDSTIPNEIYDNEPTEGFVLNKKVGGVEESWGWDVRKTYTRIYDPRGFEFEITIPNLLWILENCNCIKGKGLEGQFVYGWDGKELVLVPVESPDYKEIQAKNEVIHNNEFVKAKDLVIGTTYEMLNGEQYVYMGKYDVYGVLTNYYHDASYWGYTKMRDAGWDEPIDDTWHDDNVSGSDNTRYKTVNKGKEFWFIKLGNANDKYSYNIKDITCHFKSVTRKFSRVISTECDKYPEYYEMMQRNSEFSPINYTENKILPVAFDDFKRAFFEHANSSRTFYIHYIKNGRLTYKYMYLYYDSEKQQSYFYKNNSYEAISKTYINDDSVKELYMNIRPMYGEQYLENGKLYTRRGYYGTEE